MQLLESLQLPPVSCPDLCPSHATMYPKAGGSHHEKLWFLPLSIAAPLATWTATWTQFHHLQRDSRVFEGQPLDKRESLLQCTLLSPTPSVCSWELHPAALSSCQQSGNLGFCPSCGCQGKLQTASSRQLSHYLLSVSFSISLITKKLFNLKAWALNQQAYQNKTETRSGNFNGTGTKTYCLMMRRFELEWSKTSL